MSDDMCPNCVTPWKCNGPHVSPMDEPMPALAPLIARMVAEAERRALATCEEVDDRALRQAEERGRAIGRAEVSAVVEAVLRAPEFHIEVALGGSDYVRRVIRAALDEVTP